jgi:signal transduction histidine kinase
VGLQQRLTLFTLSLVTVLSATLGGSLIQNDFGSALTGVSNDLILIEESVALAESDKITTALSLAQNGRVPIAILLQDETGEFTAVNEPFTDYPIELIAQKSASGKEGEIGRIDGYLFTAVAIEGDASLLLIATIDRYLEERNKNIFFLLIFLFAIIIIALLLLKVVISRDVTRERESIESEERLKNEAAQKAALLDFAGDASHELRTPLTVLKGYLELGAKERINLNDHKTLEKLLKETDRMEETISHLLQVFESELLPTGESQLLDLTSLLRKAVDSFAETHPKRAVAKEISENLTLQSDSESLMRIINNALMNIHRHTREDDKVLVRARSHASEVIIEFHDAGPGFPDGNYSKKTRLFSRFDRSRSRDSGGSGLGLSIMDSSAKNLGGRIEMKQSELGGVLVEVHLPKR